jgi:aminoglycoside phosphotransferase (APT) family kinase protein
VAQSACPRARRTLGRSTRPPRPTIDHVFVDGDEVTGIIDWSEASQGDALFDLATLPLGHPEHLGDVISGYGADVDRNLISAWWSLRCLLNVRWLLEHGFGPIDEMPEIAVLQSINRS